MADAQPTFAAALAVIGSVGACSISIIGVVSFLRKGGARQGNEEATVRSLSQRVDQHEASIGALKVTTGDLTKTVAVLEDIARRQAESDVRKDQKLDRLLEGQAELRAHRSDHR